MSGISSMWWRFIPWNDTAADHRWVSTQSRCNILFCRTSVNVHGRNVVPPYRSYRIKYETAFFLVYSCGLENERGRAS